MTLCQAVSAQQSLPSPFGSVLLPAGFLENRGQVRDLDNKPVDFVYFQANLAEQQVFITRYGLSLLLSRPKKITRIAATQKNTIPLHKQTPADTLSMGDYELEWIDTVLKNTSIIPGNITTQANPRITTVQPLF
jgi:hypothetical protein